MLNVEYMVRIMSNVCDYVQEVDLFVVTPPVFTNTSESERKVRSGVPTFLMCKADGIPKPFITWRREGGEMINLQHR